MFHVIIVLSQTDSVACHSNYNLMQASNLGVVFGPVLVRDTWSWNGSNLKYQNIIVEMMIDEKDKVGLSCVYVAIILLNCTPIPIYIVIDFQ